ncbi:hypothetical protein [Alkalibacterium pelagium]|uniref:DinB family protein n=1 Tax=Alkalibacterium pelagium TaxID=426702 RepID=A0A1H7KGH3_9LACT|nr:hypothetical protein [Alkalibacterium pelagium]GEN50750.1 hypothetical protein APE02nite_14150 [Alkalibacterium pelagium]SEK86003.1 hypothetical protein SAMN04488099_107121 [Alkalibacterium pelagium]
MDQLINRIKQSLQLTDEFYLFINEECLKMKIPDAPSNTIGEQAYCIIGARESYLKALIEGKWLGFDCSLTEIDNKNVVVEAMTHTRNDLNNFIDRTAISLLDLDLLIDLHEHEVQHHGQLIRYAYANEITFPVSWKERYTV